MWMTTLIGVWAILLDLLIPTNLSWSSACSLSDMLQVFLMDGKLMHQDLQGHHKVVILKKKEFSPSPVLRKQLVTEPSSLPSQS